MASPAALTLINDFLTYAPKVAAFEAGQPVTLSVPAATETIAVPEIGNVEISESGTTVTIKKA